MKTLKILTYSISALILVVILAAFADQKNLPAKRYKKPIAGNGFALLELFTSEGCSSCPPADELLAQIQIESNDKPVYILAYHVDYWNRLGWKDIFSNPDYSKRQVQYSKWLNVPEYYTPQVVINGKAEYVGSDEPALRGSIAGALKTAQFAELSLQAQQKGDKLSVNYQVTGGSSSNQLLLAVVQKLAVSKVARGENGGRTLTHAQIVRELHTVNVSVDEKGTSVIKISHGFDTKGWEIIGFVQDTSNGEVLTATKAKFNDDVIAKK